MTTSSRLAIAVLTIGTLLPRAAAAQGTVSDYERALTIREKYQGLAVNVPEQPRWIEKTNRLWYRRSVKGGNEFVLVNADTQVKATPFDHVKLAAGLSSATGGKYTAITLPFNSFAFVDNDRAVEFTIGAFGPGGRADTTTTGGPPATWRCTLDTYTCRQPAGGGRGGRGGRGGGGLAGPVHPPFDINGVEPKKSPDGTLEALVNNYNVAIREAGKRDLTLLIFRSARRAGHGARLGRRVRRSQAVRLLHPSPARRQPAGMEDAGGRGEEADGGDHDQRVAIIESRR